MVGGSVHPHPIACTVASLTWTPVAENSLTAVPGAALWKVAGPVLVNATRPPIRNASTMHLVDRAEVSESVREGKGSV